MLRIWVVGFLLFAPFCLANDLAKTVETELRNAESDPSTFPQDPALRTLLQSPQILPDEALKAIANGLSAIYPDYLERPAEAPNDEVVSLVGSEARKKVAELIVVSTMSCCSAKIEDELTQALMKYFSLEPSEEARTSVLKALFQTLTPHPLSNMVLIKLSKIVVSEKLVSPLETERARKSIHLATDFILNRGAASCEAVIRFPMVPGIRNIF